MVRVTLALAAAVLTMPAYAAADEPKVDPIVVEATSSSLAEDKVICRSKREARTGSNMRPGKECRKASEWKEREIAAKRELQRLQDKQQTHGMGEGR
ncbi:MAG TPA: hypothetical protein VNJ05_06485 [Sphingomicrobium sp.]|nr:hypothetical protein [Sphingomicrobium sp.]